MIDAFAKLGRKANPAPRVPLRGDPARQPLGEGDWSGRSLHEAGALAAAAPLDAAADLAPVDLRRRLRDNRDAIRANYRTTLDAARGGHVITPAAEWLLDNQHIIDEGFRLQAATLGPGFLRHLPRLGHVSGGQVERAFALAWHVAALMRSDIRVEPLTEYVRGVQSRTTLTIAELWALPAFLRHVLLENLRRLSDMVVDARLRREAADRLADRLAQAEGASAHAALLAEAEAELGDPAFAMQLGYRLGEAAQVDLRAETWLHEGLAKRGMALPAVIQGEYARQSATNVTVGNIVRSLRRMGDINWLTWVEEVSRVDGILRDGGDFARLDQPTRAAYREAIERIARRSGRDEWQVAEAAVAAAAGDREAVGRVLIGDGVADFAASRGYRPTWRERVDAVARRAGWLALLVPLVAVTLLVLAVVAQALPGGWAGGLILLLAALPAADVAGGLVALAAARLIPPRRLPAYDLRAGVPADHRTLVVIPCLLTGADAIDELVGQLELHYLANPLGEVSFALVTDWRDAPTETTDSDAALLARARDGIDRLAEQYDHDRRRRFFLLHRRRLWNPSEGVWMGWERKRGKLAEMNRLLRGAQDTSFVDTGPRPPEGIRFVITLDSDTRMPRQTVASLVGKLAHPVNRPVVDPDRRAVVRGHALLQPRISASLTTGAESSIFQRVFSVSRGLDPYVFAVSDLYQDSFGEGSFTGKGIYDLDTFETVTEGRFPENAILSHDLYEGSLARAALVSDVEFVEEYPIRYGVERGRQHRWTRGDWQLVPFLARAGGGLNGLARMKMIDNLRRSATAPAWLAAAVIAWLALPPAAAVAATLALVGLVAVMPVLHIVMGAAPGHPSAAMPWHLRRVARDIGRAGLEVGLRLAFLADTAVNMKDAIARTFWRLTVSRTHLLEWTTAATAARTAQRRHWPSMALSVGLAVAIGALVALVNPGALVAALPLVAAWIAAPWIADAISRTMETEDRLDLDAGDARALRRIGRQTWRYFETFTTAATHHLPPDNVQDDPALKVAERTSPTNIGFYLLSVMSAQDLGWIGLADALDRIGATLDTLERMPRHRGHFYNWTDTRDLSVMTPAYVSSVDSGNLAGTLIALASGLRDWGGAAPCAPILGGLRDTLELLGARLGAIPEAGPRGLRPLRRRLDEARGRLEALLAEAEAAPDAAGPRAAGLMSTAETLCRLVAELHVELGTPDTADALSWAQALRDTARSVLHDSAAAADPRARARVCEALAERARLIAFQMDFRHMVDPEKQLLAVGYRPEDDRRDDSCYDLLASEARLTSFFAIAKGDLRREHWGHLGRPFASLGGGRDAALMSWSGCMFEYLMAPLVMKERAGGILNLSNNAALREQMRWGEAQGVPWGVSESAFNARDRDLNYQYYAFGVPALGLKRQIGEDVVVAPYAALLAAQFRPAEAVRNLARLAEMGALGPYGFYDAVDFTRARLSEGQRYAVVRNVMAHHHGMSIVAIANAVKDGLHRERFHADPVVQAAELILQEKSPREIVPVTRPEGGAGLSGSEGRFEARVQSETWDPANAPRDIALLSNGSFSATLSSTGAGASGAGGIALNRWLPDPAVNQGGIFLFLRDLETMDWWSATTSPRRGADEIASTLFSDHKAEFFKIAHEIETKLEVIVASEAQALGQRLTIRNRAGVERLIEVTTYGEIVLDRPENDRAHPAFSKMFVRTQITPDGTILARRRPRDPKGDERWLAHLMCGDDAAIRPGWEAETDRRAFIGRARGLGRAQAFDPGAGLTGGQGHTLDPIFALRRVVRLAPRQSVDVTVWTVMGATEDEVARAASHYAQPRSYDHELNLAWSLSQVQLRHLDVSMSDATLFRRFAALLVYPDPALAAADIDRRSGLGAQSDLWPMGISGDDPIILMRIDDESDLPVLRGALRMHRYLRARGIRCDLVILNERSTSYVQDLQAQIDALCQAALQFQPVADLGAHLFRLRRDMLAPASAATLLAAARIVLHTRNGRLADQIERLEGRRRASGAAGGMALRPRVEAHAPAAVPAPSGEGLAFWNGFGGFAEDGRSYVVRLPHGSHTPHPWINVVARDGFGFHVSAGGGGYTWAVNSRDYQITPWSNDPVVNRLGEAVHVLDRDTGRIATPFGKLSDDPEAVYETEHGLGFSRFTTRCGWVELELTMTLAADAPAKLMALRVTNPGDAPLRLEASAWVELVLGQHRARTATSLRAGWDAGARAVLACNPYETGITGRVTALAVDAEAAGWLTSRLDYLGRGGSLLRPRAVTGWPEPGPAPAARFAGETHGDPCAAVMTRLDLAPGETRTVTFVLADAPEAEIGAVLDRARAGDALERAMARAAGDWGGFLDTLQVRTPDPKLDLMVNAWLPYQAKGCRLDARSAFYQASGAFGFRDQLQDTLALMLHDPSLARRQLLNAAARQFREGDVQHWWLPATGAGVRTMISDDVVWLAFGTASYVAATGDAGILDEALPFLDGPALAEGEHDRFFQPDVTGEVAPLYEHCARALDLALARTGAKGLPLILGGDWNDGMNRVGEGGLGESVWLGWLLIAAIDAFAPLAEARGDGARAGRLREHRTQVLAALEREGWDGGWYRRAWYDDGTPLGSSASDECRIDSIAQSWALISGAAAPDRAATAVDAALSALTVPEAGILRLFAPSFDTTPHEPGYIRSYPPGVRENGGQYTHAAAWMVYALARAGRGGDAHRLFDMLNPISHALTAQAAERYRVEPYVVAADVYALEGREGMGGWTWYTGSAGWMYRAAVEGILGITLEGGEVRVRPALPDGWPGFSARLVRGGQVLEVEVARRDDGSVAVETRDA